MKYLLRFFPEIIIKSREVRQRYISVLCRNLRTQLDAVGPGISVTGGWDSLSVDAPLDEANVGRFCAMVSEMSERVQFLFVTHNKATMEAAHQLAGVTMREPGVSRLVSVDLDEATRLAGAA